jgi:hypothetical protein
MDSLLFGIFGAVGGLVGSVGGTLLADYLAHLNKSN